MPSSISNSNFLLKCLGSAIGLFLAYNFLAPRLFPLGGIGQDQQQANMIKLEEFVHSGATSYDVVIVGSSLAARLPDQGLPTNFYSLALSGSGPLTGLSVLQNLARQPKLVMIELSEAIFRASDQSLIEPLFRGLPFKIRQFFPAIRTAFQPVGLVNGFLKSRFGRKSLESEPVLQPEVMQRLVEIQTKNYFSTPDLSLIRRRLSEMKAIVDLLRKKRVVILFFEPPIHSILRTSPLATAVRNEFKAAFRQKNAHWLWIDPKDGYETRDGLHMDIPSAVRYEKLLVTRGQQIIQKLLEGVP